MSDTELPESLARRLAPLPHFEPREALWGEVLARRRRGRLRRAAFATAAAAVIALGFAATRPDERRAIDVAADPARTRTLEAAIAAARVTESPANPAVRALERELARIDEALQLAYDRAAPAHERAALWRTRSHQLDALAVAYRHADTIVRL